MRLDPLCDFELRYTSEFVLVQPYGTQGGSGYGEGEGTVRGERLNGTVRWVNHPHRRSDTYVCVNELLVEDG